MLEIPKAVWERWPGFVVAIVAMAFFATLTAPALTWINTDADGSIYLNAARHIDPSHPTGAPAFNLLNAVWLRIFPFGDPAWRLALGSAIFAGLTCALLYRETRSVLPPLIYAGSGLVVSQATIIETYSMVTFCMVGMYVYRRDPKKSVAFAFLGLGVHHLIGLTLIPMLIWHRYERYSLKPYLWLLLSPIWYVWLLTANPASLYLTDLSLYSLIDYFSGQTGLVFGLAILDANHYPSSDLIIRSKDAAIFLVGGFLAATVPLLLRRKYDLLFFLFLLPVAHYFFNLPHVAYVYMMPSFAFGAIMAWEYIEFQLPFRIERHFKTAVYGVAIVALGFNFIAYDIGETLDPELTATQFYHDLDDLPENAWVFIDVRGWEVTTIALYRNDTGRNITGQTPDYMEQDIAMMRDEILLAYHECRLFQTVEVDQTTYAVRLEEVKPWQIWPTLIEQKYQFVDFDPSLKKLDIGASSAVPNGIQLAAGCNGIEGRF